MTDLSRDERLANLDAAIAEGRVIRNCWLRSDAQGRSLVGLLAALSPEAGAARDASACPADVIPAWLAHMTARIDDNVSEAALLGILRRYAAVVRRAAVLTEEDWRRLDYAARAVALRVALPHAGTSSALVERVVALCDRSARGADVPGEEWAAASASAPRWAPAAEAGAAASAAWAAGAADSPAWAAAWAADSAAESAAESARWATEEAAWAADSAAESAAARAAEEEAWDTIANGILDAIDAACAAREASS